MEIALNNIEKQKEEQTLAIASLADLSVELPNGINTINPFDYIEGLEATSTRERAAFIKMLLLNKPLIVKFRNKKIPFQITDGFFFETNDLFIKNPYVLKGVVNLVFGEALKNCVTPLQD